jgi:hypothetical protein
MMKRRPKDANRELPSKAATEGDVFLMRLNIVRWARKAMKKIAGPVITRESRGLIPRNVYREYVAKAPNMINSPWETLSTLATPY